jgi:pimeloyl-ACP methyl ester carboxylesterase
VVFHHGIGTCMGIWAEWVPVIATHHPVLRFDMRGFGGSDVPGEAYRWTMSDLVADLWDMADQTGSARVHLVGESMGGTVVLAAAAARPARIASVTVLNATFKGDGGGELNRWTRQFAAGPAAWSRRMMENRYAPGVGDPDALAWFEAQQAKTPPHVAIGLGKVLSETDLGEALEALTAPVSIVLPDASPFVPVAHGAELAKRMKNARLRVVPGVRHGLPFSHAKEEAAHLLNFLETL